jgi:hypothetical protein
LALVAGSVAAVHLVSRLAVDLGPAPGDHIAVAGPAPGFGWSATAHLPSGRDCKIGLGREAGAGGDLYVVSRGPEGEIDAIWSSSGRSAATGPDCGNGAQVNLDRGMFAQLSAVAHGGDPVVPIDNSVAF